MPFKYRDHRGSLAASMKTVKTFQDEQELVDYLGCPDIIIKKYGDGIDNRIGWDTYIVTSINHGVFGFTDGPVGKHVDAA